MIRSCAFIFCPYMLSVLFADVASGLEHPVATHFVEPVPVDEASCRLQAAGVMPDLGRLVLRTDPVLHAGGKVIKGMYYGQTMDRPSDLVAFRLGCSGVLAQRPFLVLDFRTGIYLLDADGDGCADAAGLLADDAIDPVDFLPAISPVGEACAAVF
jgi:hypothetical protein